MMTEKEILKKIYPSITTCNVDWKKQIKEMGKLKIKDFSLFLTCTNTIERQKLYKELAKIKVNQIPHVHIRHDFQEKELDYLVERYNSKAFTIHYPSVKHFQNFKYKKQIFVENNWQTYSDKLFPEIKKFGGMCIDLSHLMIWENIKPGNLPTTRYAVEKYKVGCNHISAIKSNGVCEHYLAKLSEVDYLAELSKKYFSEYLNIELGNPIKQQLVIKKYIAKLLAKTWK